MIRLIFEIDDGLVIPWGSKSQRLELSDDKRQFCLGANGK